MSNQYWPLLRFADIAEDLGAGHKSGYFGTALLEQNIISTANLSIKHCISEMDVDVTDVRQKFATHREPFKENRGILQGFCY